MKAVELTTGFQPNIIAVKCETDFKNEKQKRMFIRYHVDIIRDCGNYIKRKNLSFSKQKHRANFMERTSGLSTRQQQQRKIYQIHLSHS